MAIPHVPSVDEQSRAQMIANSPVTKQRQWDQYFMAFARLAASNSKCGSRKIGAALVQDKRVVTTGYNGPPVGVARCSDRCRSLLPNGWMTTEPENIVDLDSVAIPIHSMGSVNPRDFSRGHRIKQWSDGNFCPRREFGFESGQGLHLCPAGHAERNALNQAARLGIAASGGTLYCYCGRPCKDCMIEIINTGVKELVFLEVDSVYDELSGYILEESGLTWREIPDLTDDVFYNMPGGKL